MNCQTTTATAQIGACGHILRFLNLSHFQHGKPAPTLNRFQYARLIDEDYPKWEDVNVDLDEDVAEAYYDHFENVGGLKLGGWPTLVQSEIFWAPWNKHPASPEYVFQIDTTEKGNWMWGDNGVGYFGRGTSRGHENEWACEWQCY